MKIKTLGVVVLLDDGNVHQVALTDEMISALLSDLRNLYFQDGKIKVLDNILDGVEFNQND